MPPAYTKLLWSKAPGIGSGPWTSPGPPAGTCWILRDVSLINASSSGVGAGCYNIQFRINGIQVLGTPVFTSLNNTFYRWADVRIRVSNGDSFQATSSDQYWSWYITGYELNV